LECLAAGDIDIVLLDLSLPDSLGLDTFTRVYDKAPCLPIIVLTGLDDEELAAKAVREGAQDYIIKGQVDSNLLARAIRYAIERKRAEKEREELILKLQDALAKVKVLSGFLPICARCKKIRDDRGYWHSVEVYVREHSEAEFTHSICPDCIKELYPWFNKDKE
jgi:DNA-binding NtrC family response regulator